MYASPSDLINRYTEEQVLLVADDDMDGGVDQQKVIDSIMDADDEIDTYLANRYELPLVAVPRVLVRLSCDIAMYRLSSEAGVLTDEKRVRYEDAIKLLDKLSKGTAKLSFPVDPEAAMAEPELDKNGEPIITDGDIEIASAERLFSRESLRGVL